MLIRFCRACGQAWRPRPVRKAERRGHTPPVRGIATGNPDPWRECSPRQLLAKLVTRSPTQEAALGRAGSGRCTQRWAQERSCPAVYNWIHACSTLVTACSEPRGRGMSGWGNAANAGPAGHRSAWPCRHQVRNRCNHHLHKAPQTAS